jgi:hypothetical protein
VILAMSSMPTQPLRARPTLPGHQLELVLDQPRPLDSGTMLAPSNAILIRHALTGDQFVAETHPVTGSGGWRNTMVGPGKPTGTGARFSSTGSTAIRICVTWSTRTRFCVVSFTIDWLFPTSKSRAIVHALHHPELRRSLPRARHRDRAFALDQSQGHEEQSPRTPARKHLRRAGHVPAAQAPAKRATRRQRPYIRQLAVFRVR